MNKCKFNRRRYPPVSSKAVYLNYMRNLKESLVKIVCLKFRTVQEVNHMVRQKKSKYFKIDSRMKCRI